MSLLLPGRAVQWNVIGGAPLSRLIQLKENYHATLPSHLAESATVSAVAARLALVPRLSLAAKNSALRASLKYQETPKDGKQCSKCSQFIPGKSPEDLGGCKVMAGDTEISPTGYCIAFVELKK